MTSVKSRIGRLVTDHGDKLVASINEGTFANWLNGLHGTRADKAGDKFTLTTRDNLKKNLPHVLRLLHRPRVGIDQPGSVSIQKRTRQHRIAKRKAPAIMLPEDVKKFLHKVEEVAEPILPFWLVKFFAGIRDAEADRMEWNMIDLKSGMIHLPAAITKTGDARKVKIEPALAEWLTPLAQKELPSSESMKCIRSRVILMKYQLDPPSVDGRAGKNPGHRRRHVNHRPQWGNATQTVLSNRSASLIRTSFQTVCFTHTMTRIILHSEMETTKLTKQHEKRASCE